MRDKQLHTTLVNHPFFADFRRDHIGMLELCANDAHFSAGEWLIRESKLEESFYLIQTGDVAISTFVPAKGSVTYYSLHENELLGWSWLFPPFKSLFDGKAMSDVTAVEFDASAVRRMANHDYEFGYRLVTQFAQIMLERLDLVRRQTLDLYG